MIRLSSGVYIRDLVLVYDRVSLLFFCISLDSILIFLLFVFIWYGRTSIWPGRLFFGPCLPLDREEGERVRGDLFAGQIDFVPCLNWNFLFFFIV